MLKSVFSEFFFFLFKNHGISKNNALFKMNYPFPRFCPTPIDLLPTFRRPWLSLSTTETLYLGRLVWKKWAPTSWDEECLVGSKTVLDDERVIPERAQNAVGPGIHGDERTQPGSGVPWYQLTILLHINLVNGAVFRIREIDQFGHSCLARYIHKKIAHWRYTLWSSFFWKLYSSVILQCRGHMSSCITTNKCMCSN